MYRLSVSNEKKTSSSQNIIPYHILLLCRRFASCRVWLLWCCNLFLCGFTNDMGQWCFKSFRRNTIMRKYYLYRLPLLCCFIGNFLCGSTNDMTQWCLRILESNTIMEKYYTVFLFCAELFVSDLSWKCLSGFLEVFCLLPMFCGLS